MLGSSFAYGQDLTGYPANTTIRDYAKRDRVQIGGLSYVSPSQLHENAGLRTRFGAEVQQSDLRLGGVKTELTTPSATASVAYGWDSLTIGLDASYLSAENDSKGLIDESFRSTKAIPQIAYTLGSNVTIGAGAELNWLDVKEEGLREDEFSYQLTRPIAGISFHTPQYEFGLSYAGEVIASDELSSGINREGTLSLSSFTSELTGERSVYLPAQATLFARGNLTDNVSLMSSVTMSRYDGNVQGAVGLFEDYKDSDRLAAKLMGTYWTDTRSHISLAAEYKGAATTAVGSDEAGLGYRLVNLYGGSIEGAVAFNRKAYVGLLASYTRGERSDTDDKGVIYSGQEESTRVAGFVTVKI
jgi:hypothetical protein